MLLKAALPILGVLAVLIMALNTYQLQHTLNNMEGAMLTKAVGQMTQANTGYQQQAGISVQNLSVP